MNKKHSRRIIIFIIIKYTYSGSSAATWSGLQLVNHDDTSNRTAIGVTFGHRSSSSGIAGIISTSASADRGDIRFITRGSGNTIAERMRIDDDGHVICPEGVTLGTAVGTYVAAKTLDDYETGIFTPTFTASTTNPTVTYSNQDGDYVKIGDVVHFQIYFRVTETSAGSGNLKISGLPFTSKNENIYGGMQVSFLLNWGGSGGPETGQINGNSTDVQLHRFGTNTSAVNAADIATDTFVRATGQYIAA